MSDTSVFHKVNRSAIQLFYVIESGTKEVFNKFILSILLQCVRVVLGFVNPRVKHVSLYRYNISMM